LAYAPIFPASLGFASKKFIEQRDAAIGILLACGILGGVLLPYFIGLLGGDIRWLLLFAIVLVWTQALLFMDSSKPSKSRA
jgi:fucose permease